MLKYVRKSFGYGRLEDLDGIKTFERGGVDSYLHIFISNSHKSP